MAQKKLTIDMMIEIFEGRLKSIKREEYTAAINRRNYYAIKASGQIEEIEGFIKYLKRFKEEN